jgi:hypothetical protein
MNGGEALIHQKHIESLHAQNQITAIQAVPQELKNRVFDALPGDAKINIAILLSDHRARLSEDETAQLKKRLSVASMLRDIQVKIVGHLAGRTRVSMRVAHPYAGCSQMKR